MPHTLIRQADIDTFQRDGVIRVKGLFRAHVDTLRKGVERNMAEPGEYAAENSNLAKAGASSTTIATGAA